MSAPAEKKGLKIGDVVRLNSGGPSMTVTNVGEAMTWCQRFTDDGQLRSEQFLTVALSSLHLGPATA
jgi:uncharacterized protein YodC (DUF2158 family)